VNATKICVSTQSPREREKEKDRGTEREKERKAFSSDNMWEREEILIESL
jgi:hypothetical protein